MLKMIIVEDEKLERDGLVEYFDWNSMEIQVVGTACDGIEGLELAEKTKPDIIITDIKMPGMDGLMMSQKIRDILPQTKIIILSGFDDFKFAKQAIGLSASAYILKPIDEDELISSVKNIVIECKKDQDKETVLSKKYYSSKTNFLIDLIQGKSEIENLKETAVDLGFNINDKAEFVIVSIIAVNVDNEVYKELYNVIENLVNNNICFVVPIEEEKVIHICIRIPCKQNVDLSSVCKNIFKHIEPSGVNCFMGIGTSTEDFYNISEAALNAKKALEYGLFWYDSGIFYYNDIFNGSEINNNHISDFIILGNKLAKLLLHAVVGSEEDKVREILDQIFIFINENKYIDRKYICNYLYNIIYEISLILFSVDKNNAKVLSEENDFGLPLFELKSINSISEYTYDFFEKVIQVINEKRNNKDERIINTVIKLTKERYMTGLSLKILASEVYLSPNYLGHIFKKYMGKSFNDYLCEVRMEKAKELLKDSNKKISRVAEEIGIPNTSYFCMVFKNMYGMAPKEYQDIILRN